MTRESLPTMHKYHASLPAFCQETTRASGLKQSLRINVEQRLNLSGRISKELYVVFVEPASTVSSGLKEAHYYSRYLQSSAGPKNAIPSPMSGTVALNILV